MSLLVPDIIGQIIIDQTLLVPSLRKKTLWAVLITFDKYRIKNRGFFKLMIYREIQKLLGKL